MAQETENLVRNGIPLERQLIDAHGESVVGIDESDPLGMRLVCRDVRQVDDHHIHADSAQKRGTMVSDDSPSLSGKEPGQPVSIAHSKNPNPAIPIDPDSPSVGDGASAGECADCQDSCLQAKDRAHREGRIMSSWKVSIEKNSRSSPEGDPSS